MSNLLKPTLYFLTFAGLAYAGLQATNAFKEIQRFAEGLKFKITGIGIPRISGGTLRAPIRVQFENQGNISADIDQIYAEVFTQQKDGFVKAGQTLPQAITVQPGVNEHVIQAELDLNQANPFEGQDFWSLFYRAASKSLYVLKVVVHVNFKGQEFTTEEITRISL
jgi:hypothetical protein